MLIQTIYLTLVARRGGTMAEVTAGDDMLECWLNLWHTLLTGRKGRDVTRGREVTMGREVRGREVTRGREDREQEMASFS